MRRVARPWSPLADALWIAAMGGAGLLVWWLADLGPAWRLGSVALELGVGLLLLLIAHELLHMLMAGLAGVPWGGIGLRIGRRLLHVTVTRRPGPRAWQATALAPSVVLSVALLVPLLRSGDPFWLALLVVHVASCRVDWRFAREALGPPRPDDLPDSRVPGLVTLVLAAGLAALLPTLPASTWLRADQIVCLPGAPAPASLTGDGDSMSWRFRAADAQQLVLVWKTRQGSQVVGTVELALPLARAHGELAVRIDAGVVDGDGATLWASVDGGVPRRVSLPGSEARLGGTTLYSLEPAPLRAGREPLLATFLLPDASDTARDRESPGDASAPLRPDQLRGCSTLSLRVDAAH